VDRTEHLVWSIISISSDGNSPEAGLAGGERDASSSHRFQETLTTSQQRAS